MGGQKGEGRREGEEELRREGGEKGEGRREGEGIGEG